MNDIFARLAVRATGQPVAHVQPRAVPFETETATPLRPPPGDPPSDASTHGRATQVRGTRGPMRHPTREADALSSTPPSGAGEVGSLTPESPVGTDDALSRSPTAGGHPLRAEALGGSLSDALGAAMRHLGVAAAAAPPPRADDPSTGPESSLLTPASAVRSGSTRTPHPGAGARQDPGTADTPAEPRPGGAPAQRHQRVSRAPAAAVGPSRRPDAVAGADRPAGPPRQSGSSGNPPIAAGLRTSPRPGPINRSLSAQTLLRDHLAPALARLGAITEREQQALALAPPVGRAAQDRPVAVGLTPVDVPEGGTVHVHIDRVEVRRPHPGPVPGPAPAAQRPPPDHAAYLARQQDRWRR